MKAKDKLDALVEERIDYVKELVIRNRCDELYNVIYKNFDVDKFLKDIRKEEEYQEEYKKWRKNK